MVEFKNNGKTKLVVIGGATGIGKSHYAISLAKEIDGEIISSDSMQVYKYMDIGTAKVGKEEMMGIRHHLIDIKYPDESYDIFEFQKDAKKAIIDISSRGKIPIICGGTGFYIQSVTKDISFNEYKDSSYKEELNKILKLNGAEYIYELLKEVDPEYALKVHFNNTRRVINALSFYKETNTKLSEHNKLEFEKESPYDLAFYVLNTDRESIYEKINNRVEKMIELGLVDEVKKLRDMGYDSNLKSMQGLDYKEINMYLDGTCSLDEAIELMKKNTRHFAKRQITWFKREKDAIWLKR